MFAMLLFCCDFAAGNHRCLGMHTHVTCSWFQFPNPADGFRSRVPITTPGFRLQRVPGTGNLAAAARHRWRRTSPAIRFRGTSDERHWKKILLKIKACQPTKIRLQSTNERNFVHISSIMSTDELQEHI